MSATDINISFGANISGMQQALADIRQSVNQTCGRISSSFKGVNRTLDSSVEKLAAMSTAIRNSFRIATVAGTALRNAVAVPLREFSRFEDAATRMAPLVGGLDSAKILCAQLRDEAANGTMSFEQLASVAGRLASVFKSSSDIKKWTTAFHDLSAGTGLDVNELVGNFVKSKASGRFEAGFLDMFAQKGVNIFPELVKQTGVAETELRKMAAAGTLSFAEVEKAILAVSTGTGQFAGQAAKMSDTFNGSVGTMIENWKTFLAEVGKPIAAVVKFFVKPLGEIPLMLRDIMHLGLDDETIYYQGLADASQTLQRAFDSMETAKNAAALKDAAEQAKRAVHDLSGHTVLNTDIVLKNIYALERKKTAELELAEATRKRAEAEAEPTENNRKAQELWTVYSRERKNATDKQALEAEISGNAKLLEQEKVKARYAELVAQYKSQGFKEADADRMARELLTLETAKGLAAENPRAPSLASEICEASASASATISFPAFMAANPASFRNSGLFLRF